MTRSPQRLETGNWAAVFDLGQGTLRASSPPLRRSGLSLFFSGYIANPGEVAALLGQPGLRDPHELAHAAWLRWECRLARHVLGAFGIAVLDHRQGVLTLVQDALGQRPLFFAREDGAEGALCRIADTLDGLLASGGARGRCLDYFASWLRFGHGASDLTPYEGVRRLAHGRHVRIGARTTQQGAAVTPAAAQYAWSHTRAEAERELVRQVEQAVARECAGLRDPLFELSGGLDSSTVVALARRGAGARRLHAVTWGSPHDDDIGYAAPLAQQLDLAQRIVMRPDDDFIDWDSVHDWAEPGNEFSGTLRKVLRELVAGRHDAVVTGVGGDDVFHARGMAPTWLADLLRAGRLGQALRTIRTAPPDGTPQRLFVSQLWRFGLRPLFGGAGVTGFTPHYAYCRDFMERCAALAPADMNLPREASAARSDFWRNLRMLVANRVAPGHLMPEIGFRHPLLSLPLVEFSAAILGRYETHLRPDRTLQRSAFAGRVPAPILERTSKGGSLAQEAAYWRGDDARRRFRTDASHAVALGLVDARQWEALLGAARFGRVANLREFDFIMKTEIWLRGAKGGAASRSAELAVVAGPPD